MASGSIMGDPGTCYWGFYLPLCVVTFFGHKFIPVLSYLFIVLTFKRSEPSIIEMYIYLKRLNGK